MSMFVLQTVQCWSYHSVAPFGNEIRVLQHTRSSPSQSMEPGRVFRAKVTYMGGGGGMLAFDQASSNLDPRVYSFASPIREESLIYIGHHGALA